MPIKTNIGGEPQEELLSSFPTQEEITKRELPEELSKDDTKDLLEHKNSSLLDHKDGSVDFQHFTVRLRAMFERLFGEEALDNLLDLLIESNYTQRVLHGYINSEGDPAFLSEENVGNVTLLATTVPALLAFANGFDDRTVLRYIKRVVADIEPDNWKNLLGLKKHFLFADYDLENDTLSYNKTPVPVQYAQKFNNPNLISTHSLLHFEEDGTPLDEYTDITWTASGAVRSAVQKKFGTYSYLFDGANDYIETADIIDLQRPFTIEVWFYSTSDTQAQNIVGNKGTYGFRCMYRGDVAGDYVDYWVSSDGANWDIMNTIDGAITVTKDEWHKLAFEWDGYFYRGYIDGVLDMETASTVPMNILTGIQIGNYNSDGASAFLGYIDEFRLTISNCRYGTAYTPETEAFSPDAQWFDTQNMKYCEGANGNWTEKKRLILGQANADRRVGALLHFNAAADTTDWTKLIDEYGNKWTFGNQARLDTDDNGGGNIAPKFGNRLLYLDGVGDYGHLNLAPNYQNWSKAWTIEFWYFSSDVTRAIQQMVHIHITGVNYGIQLRHNNDNKMYVYLSSNGTADDISNGGSTAALAWVNFTWYKITVEWDRTYYKLYKDGVEVLSITDSNSICNTNAILLGIHRTAVNALLGGFDEFRLTLGHNRHGGAHTPETSELLTEGTIDNVESYLVRTNSPDPLMLPELYLLPVEQRGKAWDININPTSASWTLCDVSKKVPKGTKMLYGFFLVTPTDATPIIWARPYGSDMYDHEQMVLNYAQSNNSWVGEIPCIDGKFEVREYGAAYEAAAFMFQLWGWR